MFRNIFERILQWFFQLIFKVRYRVKVKGLENLHPENLKKPGGVLILPNHPTVLVDPVLVSLYTWQRFQPRPVIVEYMYNTPGIRWLMDLIKALPIPNFSSTSNSIKKRRSEKALEKLIGALQDGENVLIYPAGKTKRSGYEEIGGSSALYQIFQRVDDLNVVLIRTTGLWGSSFSRAVTGQPADMMGMVKKGFWYAVKNLLFLNPKRDVLVELEIADETMPIKGSKMELNRWLEQWYNKPFPTPEGEPLSLIPYSYWNPVTPEVAYKGRHHLVDHRDITEVSKEIKQDVIREIARIANRSEQEIEEQQTLSSDLGLDSLDVADLAAFMGDVYGVKGLTTEDLSTVSQVISLAAQGEQKETPSREIKDNTPKQWSDDRREGKVSIAPGKTLIESFLHQARKTPKANALASDLSGIITYKKALIAVALLAKNFQKLEGKRVGVMLPATPAVHLTVLALQLAGKTPVMINWTQGPRHLESVVKSSGIQKCLTSWAFIEKLEGVEFGPLDDMTVMLEEMKADFSLFDKLSALWTSYRSPRAILSSFQQLHLSADDVAVILYTSGTEADPKGVPLTHKNILSNLTSALQVLELDQSDRMMAILPPFHSFGFTVTGLLPLVTAIPEVAFADPTDGLGVAYSIHKWQATLLAGAPSFLNGIFQSGDPELFKTLRIVVTGAEKAPKSLIAHIQEKAPQAALVEGYGITECSPILSVNSDATQSHGVGRPIPDVEFLFVHPETHQELPVGERGLLLVRGPNVFHGYLKGTERDPFITIEGKKWYNTGDLGYLDQGGNLVLAGRLKRFTKIGGEMVSLGAIEEAILTAAPEQKWPLLLDGPSVAVISEEGDKKTRLILCCTFESSVREVNKVLLDAGFSNLVRISDIKQVEEIPVMGTGKVNYRALIPASK